MSVVQFHFEPPNLNLLEQIPILDLEALPDLGGVVDGVADEAALLPQLQVDVLLVVLALDVRHVDGDEDVGQLALEAHQRQDDGREIGARRSFARRGGRGRGFLARWFW